MSIAQSMTPGLSATHELVVTEQDTAISMGSGDVPVLATPRVVALAEQAASAAIVERLEDDMTSVGVRVEVDHMQASQVGVTVTAHAILEAVEGRKLDFSFTLTQDDDVVAKGTHRRVIARRAVFEIAG